MTEAFVLEARRTAIGRRGGALAQTRPDDLAAKNLRSLVEESGIDAGVIEDVIMGCVTQVGEQGMNIARTAALIAGFPISVTGTTVNRMCGSSLQTVNFAAQAVMSGMQDVVVGAGVESMTRVTMGSDVAPLSEGLTARFDIINQGLSAELIAKKWGHTREELDRFSLESHRRALVAIDEGYFAREIGAIDVEDEAGATVTFETDEGPRRGSTAEKVAKLKPAFRDDGVITAASSSQISDGAAAVLIGSREGAEKVGLAPRARIVATAVAGVDPTIMLTGPIPVTRKVLKKAGMSLGDIDLFEVNEAFASVVLAWADDMEEDREALLARTNVNGGAIALGHPLGCSGARLLTTLLYELERRDLERGLATLCIGFGQAVAAVIERV